MYYVTKSFSVPVGHRLSKHKGLCRNIHGHNFTTEVTIYSENLNCNDMVMDFKDLKQIVNDILDQFDHATVLNISDHDNIKHLRDQGYKMVFLGTTRTDPTAEAMAKYLYYEIKKKLPKGIGIYCVLIRENEKSWCEYVETVEEIND